MIKKEKEEETFADMRRSIQMMTHTSIILAGGLKRQPPSDGSDAPEDGVIIEEENGSDSNNNQATPEHQQKNTYHSNSNYRNNNKKGFKERIQNKLAFTFQRQYQAETSPSVTTEQQQDNPFSENSSMVTTPDRDMGIMGGNNFDIPAHERTPLNGNVSMGRALPEINIDSPPPLISSRGGSFDSRPPSMIGRFDNFPLPPPITTSSSSASSGGVIMSSSGGCGVGNKITKANKGEAVWFIENHEQQNKESSI